MFVSISKCARLKGASCCLCFSVGLSAISGENKFAPWDDPKVWHVLYADPVTCDSSVPALEDVTFTLQMLNPDSGGKPVIHCGCDETGSFLLIICNIVIIIAGIFFPTVRALWLLGGHVTSNNDTVCHQNLGVGNIAKFMTSEGNSALFTHEC